MSATLNQERLLQVLLAPQIPKGNLHRRQERASHLPCRHRCDQAEIKAAVELDVQRSRPSRSRLPTSKARSNASAPGAAVTRWKKAFVSLKPGQEINFAEGGMPDGSR